MSHCLLWYFFLYDVVFVVVKVLSFRQAEALNGIFDLFSEDGEFTDIIRQLELLPALAAFLPHLTQRVCCAFLTTF